MNHTYKGIIFLSLALIVAVFASPSRTAIDDPYVIPTPKMVSLSIESIDVHAPIEEVGLSGTAMAVPEDPSAIGWYKHGVSPGNSGSAVMAGHVNWNGGLAGVFVDLHLMNRGDIITVHYEDTSQVSFMVHNIQRYPLDHDTRDVFIADDTMSHLNLITCDGDWDTTMDTHELRLVVFSTKI